MSKTTSATRATIGAAITSAALRTPSRRATTTVAAAPAGKVIAAPTSAPKRPGAKASDRDDGDRRPRDRDRAPGVARRERRDSRPDGEQEHRADRRLELVADPEEADAEGRVRAEQRQRRQRRAEDDVDRGGDDRDRGGGRERAVRGAPPIRGRSAAIARAASSGAPAPTIIRSTSSLGIDRGGEQEDRRDDRHRRREDAEQRPRGEAAADERQHQQRAATQITKLIASTSQRLLETSAEPRLELGDRRRRRRRRPSR